MDYKANHNASSDNKDNISSSQLAVYVSHDWIKIERNLSFVISPGKCIWSKILDKNNICQTKKGDWLMMLTEK
jgi:hypothetical protein